MILLTEVAKKLENILNGSDTEFTQTNPTPYFFKVQTEGYHIDNIIVPKEFKNFIPVFVSSMGGQFNPVKDLKQSSSSVQIVFYYPVRFKEDFYALGDFLVDAFVGTSLTYGSVSGKAISNLSVATFGEITDLDFKQFEEWVNTTYGLPLEKMEPYMSMTIVLYLTSAGVGYVFGNDIECNLSVTINSNTYSLDDVAFDSGSILSQTQSQNEQPLGTSESDAFPFATTYGASVLIYPNLDLEAKESTTLVPKYFYREIIKEWFNGNAQDIVFDLTIKFKNTNYSALSFTRKAFLQSVNLPINKGQLLSLTLTFAKRKVIS